MVKTIGGLKEAQEVNREIAKQVDVMIGRARTAARAWRAEPTGAMVAR